MGLLPVVLDILPPAEPVRATGRIFPTEAPPLSPFNTAVSITLLRDPFTVHDLNSTMPNDASI